MAVALITGGSQGLGLALAESLARDGWSLVIDARRADRLDAGRAQLAAAGAGAVHAIAGDVTDLAHRDALVAVARELGGLDLLVNNASSLGPSPLPLLRDLDADALAGVLTTNVVAPLALVRLALPLLRARGGRVLNISSDAAVEPYEGWGAYGASKAALDHATRVLAAEEPDLRIYSVDPGDLRTEMHQAAFPGEDISDRPLPHTAVPALRRLVDGNLPSGRYRASDLAAEVAVG